MVKVRFVMGVQRSGTNVLFRSLKAAPGVAGFNEDDPTAFDDGFLRPESFLRPHLGAGFILFKPISESKKRPLDAVMQEWSMHQPRVAWIYRNPIDVYGSHIERWEGYRGRPEAFAADWAGRNQTVLDALGVWGEAITIVSYTDLCSDPEVFKHLCVQLGMDGSYRFGPGTSRAGSDITALECTSIREGTSGVFDALQEHRGQPGSDVSAWFRSGAQAAGAVSAGWRRLRSG